MSNGTTSNNTTVPTNSTTIGGVSSTVSATESRNGTDASTSKTGNSAKASVAPAPVNKTNLIVNYLPQNFTDAEFHELFSAAGVVTASKIVRDRASGYSYGFGFIDYATETEATLAIQTLNGFALQHKRIKVSYARQGENVKGANLYIRHLPRDMGERELAEMFSPYGHIVQVRVLRDASGVSRGVGFVLFSTRAQAQAALSATDGAPPPPPGPRSSPLGGYQHPLSVKFAEDNRLKMRPNPMAPISPTNAPIGYAGCLSGAGFGGCAGSFGRGGYVDYGLQTRSRISRVGGEGERSSSGSGGGAWGSQCPLGYRGGAVMGGGGYVLFVFNIGADTDEFALWKMFTPFGTVQKVAVVRDTEKKTGKGYGFVTMLDYGEAVTAIRYMDGVDLGGNRRLQVSFKQ